MPYSIHNQPSNLLCYIFCFQIPKLYFHIRWNVHHWGSTCKRILIHHLDMLVMIKWRHKGGVVSIESELINCLFLQLMRHILRIHFAVLLWKISYWPRLKENRVREERKAANTRRKHIQTLKSVSDMELEKILWKGVGWNTSSDCEFLFWILKFVNYLISFHKNILKVCQFHFLHVLQMSSIINFSEYAYYHKWSIWSINSTLF